MPTLRITGHVVVWSFGRGRGYFRFNTQEGGWSQWMQLGSPELVAATSALFASDVTSWDTDAQALVQSDQALSLSDAKGGDPPFPRASKKKGNAKSARAKKPVRARR